jgi:signal transduction histidine kinase
MGVLWCCVASSGKSLHTSGSLMMPVVYPTVRNLPGTIALEVGALEILSIGAGIHAGIVSNSHIRFQEPTDQEEHRWLMLGLMVVVIAEAALVGYLLILHVRRRALEQELERRVEDLTAELGERGRVENDLRRTSDGLHRLSRHLLSVQEDERRRIARNLHDDIGQALSATKINLQFMHRNANDAEQRIRDSVATLDCTLSHIRELSFDLHPSVHDDVGLATAMQRFLERFQKRTGIHCTLSPVALPHRLSLSLDIVCFRVLQEATACIAKYSRANALTVTLRYTDQSIEMEIADNGAGFDPEQIKTGDRSSLSLGLAGIEERVSHAKGTLGVFSTPGGGTRLLAIFPYTLPHPGEVTR